MFVTENFVYLHVPKTGGTFVAAILAAIHARRGDHVETVWIDESRSAAALPEVGPGVAVRLMFTSRYQHGRRREVPAPYAGRPVLATIRNPFDRYVSQYEFAWWRQQPDLFGPVDAIRARHPAFPDLTFEEFVYLANDTLVPYRSAQHPENTPGFHTQQFVDYLFPDPASTLPHLWNGGEPSRAAVRRDIEQLHLVDQARLNDELGGFLTRMGYAADEVALAREADRVLPPEGGRAAGAPWEPYYSAELKAFVRDKERLLFSWFPHFVA